MRLITKMIVLWLSLGSVLFATDLRYVRIDFPNGASTLALGINARGDIVGRYDGADGFTHGFLLHRGVFSSIDVPKASFTAARGINARGDIVGRTIDADGNEHGYLLHNGEFTLIDYPGASATTARGINNAGDITGRHFDELGRESGFILRDGTFLDVHVPLGFTTDVWMAEDNGRVMVGDAAMRPDFGLHGYVRNGPGDFQLIDFPGLTAPCTAPRWINERGDIVGLFAYINEIGDCYAEPPTHGFLLRHGEYTAIDFRDPPAPECSGSTLTAPWWASSTIKRATRTDSRRCQSNDRKNGNHPLRWCSTLGESYVSNRPDRMRQLATLTRASVNLPSKKLLNRGVPRWIEEQQPCD